MERSKVKAFPEEFGDAILVVVTDDFGG